LKGSGNEPLSKNSPSELDAISPHHVKQVLDAAVFAHPLPSTPLQSSLLFLNYVQQQTSVDAPLSKTLEDFLLLELLNDQIYTGLMRHRELFGLATPIRNAPLKQMLTELNCDFRQNAIELEAWSVLYFRYVRVELQLSWSQFEAVTLQDQRTLRRRQQRGIFRLTHHLICEDLSVRKDANSGWLHLAEWVNS
jgi:hypothetical protein